jgi:HlyD family secretion protein
MRTKGVLAWAMVLGGVVCLSACGDKAAAPADKASAPHVAASGPKASLTVQVVSALKQDWPRTLTAHGAIAPWQEAIIGAELSGIRLLDVNVNVGDAVRKGQVLASLKPDAVQADLQASRASLAEAQALQTEAKANADRARQLRQSDAVSAQEAQRSITAELTAAARVESLKAQVVSNELRLSQTRILAPDDGVISNRQATVGATVQPGQELFRLIRQSRLEWRAEVAAADVAQLKPGMPVTLTVPGGAASGVSGRVRMLAPTVDASTRNGLVYVDLHGAAAQAAGLRPGMFASGSFEISRAPALTVPQSAVLMRDGFALVFVVKERKGQQATVQQDKVQLGRRQGDRVEVLLGLTPEAELVAVGAGFLVDGDTVNVVQP